jgi:Spy/CpxP family protein refolding chaperone
MHAVRITSIAVAALLASASARAAQLPSDDPFACLLPAFAETQTGPQDTKTDARGDKIDPKAAEAAAKAKAAHKWWRSDEMRAQFGISDPQSQKLDEIYHSFYASLKSGMADVERYQKDVSKMMAEGSSSEVDVLHAIDKLETAKAGLARQRMLMLYRMYRVLSPEQRIKVKKFQEQKDAAASAPR